MRLPLPPNAGDLRSTTRTRRQRCRVETNRVPRMSAASPRCYDDVPDEVLRGHVIPKLGVSERVVLSRVDRRTRALFSNSSELRPRVTDFVGSVARLCWARDNDCPWNESTCMKIVAAGGECLEVLAWARALDPPCPWEASSCAVAARRGHLAVLKWMRTQDPPCCWDTGTVNPKP